MILVTGGTGLVGAHLLYELTSEGSQVRAIYRSEDRIEKTKQVFGYYTDAVASLFEKIEWVRADICDLTNLEQAFEQIERVYHCAALISFDPNDLKLLHQINVVGTANVVNLCLKKGITKICHVSSIAALGPSIGQQPIDEENEWNGKNASVYALTKRNSELEVWRGTQEGLKAIIVNPGVILGPGFWEGGSGTLFYEAAKERSKTAPGGTGFIAVHDVVRAMLQLMDAAITNERFILVEENERYLSILTRIAAALEKRPPTRTFNTLALAIFWRLDWLRANLFGRKRILSKNMARELPYQEQYHTKKIQHALGTPFKGLKDTIPFAAEKFKEDCPQLF